MEKLKQTLSQINWNFPDYNSTKYPLDINSIPWYPATFPAPIPKFLIALLTSEGDIVLDPFGGKGTTCVESLKQNRVSYYNDLNYKDKTDPTDIIPYLRIFVFPPDRF